MATLNSAPTLSRVATQQVDALFDVLTLLAAAAALNQEIEEAPHDKDRGGLTAPHPRLDSLLRLAEDKVQDAIRAISAVN